MSLGLTCFPHRVEKFGEKALTPRPNMSLHTNRDQSDPKTEKPGDSHHSCLPTSFPEWTATLSGQKLHAHLTRGIALRVTAKLGWWGAGMRGSRVRALTKASHYFLFKNTRRNNASQIPVPGPINQKGWGSRNFMPMPSGAFHGPAPQPPRSHSPALTSPPGFFVSSLSSFKEILACPWRRQSP